MIIKNGKRIDGCTDTLPVGTVQPFLGLTPPLGYLVCQGQLVSKVEYPELYKICGDAFGTSTSTHFYLPDLRGKTIAGYDSSKESMNSIGKLIGAETHRHLSPLTWVQKNGEHFAGVTNSLGSEWVTGSRDFYGGVTNEMNDTSTGLAENGWTVIAYYTSMEDNYQPTITMNWIVKAAMLIPEYFVVENTLTSTSTSNALSAAQGKILNNSINSHTHGLSHHSLYCPVEDVTEGGWEILDPTYSRKEVWLKSLRFRANAPEWLVGNYSTGIAFGGGDTKGVMSLAYHSPLIKFAGGNADAPSWYMGLTGSGSTTYDLNSFVQKPDVLWSNPSPKSTFSAQTINVTNLSSYSYIEVIFYNWVDGQYGYQSVKAPVENGGVVNLCFTINLYDGEDTKTCHFGSRLGTMNTSNNTIAWQTQHGAVVYVDGTSVGANNNNQWGVPVKILGYKI